MRSPPPTLRRRHRRERVALPFASLRWCHLVVFSSWVVLFQSRFSAFVSGDVINDGGGVPGTTDIIVTDTHDRIIGDGDQISEEIGPETAKGNYWEGDEDDDDSVAANVDNGAENESGEHYVSVVEGDTIESPAGPPNGEDESGIGLSNVPDELADTASGGTHIGHVEGTSLEQVSTTNEAKSTSEWPDDEDATIQVTASAAKNDAPKDTDITPGENANPTSVQVSVEGEHAPPRDWPDDDDDVAVEIVSESVNSIIPVTENGAGDTLIRDTTSKTALPLDDDDDDDVNTAVEAYVSDKVPNIGSTDSDDTGLSSATAIDGNEDSLELSRLHSQPTTYHRSQSSENDAVGEEQGADVEDTILTVEVLKEDAAEAEKAEETTQETVENDTRAENGSGVVVPDELPATNVGNDENVLSIPTETNLAPDGNPSETMLPGPEQPQQPPIQEWGDEDEDSLFETVQSTFNVILLAVGLTSFLVFRKRVKDRVLADPSLSVPGAMKDEIIDVVIRVVSWVTSTASGANRNVSNAEVGNDTSTGFGSSRVSETIPLSTATDEEWGWEDEDMGTKLELSAMGGSDEKEDDDLAMALAMSISDSRNGSDEATGMTASVLKPIRPSDKNGSKFSPSTNKDKTLRSSSLPKFTNTSFETPSYSAGGDSIEDLLGKMGGTGGPVIKSFGQKPVTITKPKPQPKNESADDIFASMGLATSYPSTKSGGWQASASTQFKTNAPKSAPLSSLLADAFDGGADADTWGDDVDLDDLLD